MGLVCPFYNWYDDGYVGGVLFIISVLLFEPSSTLLSLLWMVDFPYCHCHRCSVRDNQIHSHRLYCRHFITHRQYIILLLRLLMPLLIKSVR